MRTITINALHCHQSTYNLRNITVLAKKVHDPLTRKYLADKIISRHVLLGHPDQAGAVNHALIKLGDERRV